MCQTSNTKYVFSPGLMLKERQAVNKYQTLVNGVCAEVLRGEVWNILLRTSKNKMDCWMAKEMDIRMIKQI